MRGVLNAFYMLTPPASSVVTALTFLDHCQALIWADNRELMLQSGGFEAAVFLYLCHRWMGSF